MKSLKDLAIEAHNRQRKVEEKQQSEINRAELSKRAERLITLIGNLVPNDQMSYIYSNDDPTWGVVGTVNDEDLRFALDDENELTLLGECPHCGDEVRSRFIESRARLGEMIENFQPEPAHRCSGIEATGAPKKYLFHGGCNNKVYPQTRNGKYYCPVCQDEIL